MTRERQSMAFKKQTRTIRRLQTGHPHLGPWQNYGANPLGVYFQPYESCGDKEQCAWI